MCKYEAGVLLDRGAPVDCCSCVCRCNNTTPANSLLYSLALLVLRPIEEEEEVSAGNKNPKEAREPPAPVLAFLSSGYPGRQGFASPRMLKHHDGHSVEHAGVNRIWRTECVGAPHVPGNSHALHPPSCINYGSSGRTGCSIGPVPRCRIKAANNTAGLAFSRSQVCLYAAHAPPPAPAAGGPPWLLLARALFYGGVGTCPPRWYLGTGPSRASPQRALRSLADQKKDLTFSSSPAVFPR